MNPVVDMSSGGKVTGFDEQALQTPPTPLDLKHPLIYSMYRYGYSANDVARASNIDPLSQQLMSETIENVEGNIQSITAICDETEWRVVKSIKHCIVDLALTLHESEHNGEWVTPVVLKQIKKSYQQQIDNILRKHQTANQRTVTAVMHDKALHKSEQIQKNETERAIEYALVSNVMESRILTPQRQSQKKKLATSSPSLNQIVCNTKQTSVEKDIFINRSPNIGSENISSENNTSILTPNAHASIIFETTVSNPQTQCGNEVIDSLSSMNTLSFYPQLSGNMISELHPVICDKKVDDPEAECESSLVSKHLSENDDSENDKSSNSTLQFHDTNFTDQTVTHAPKNKAVADSISRILMNSNDTSHMADKAKISNHNTPIIEFLKTAVMSHDVKNLKRITNPDNLLKFFQLQGQLTRQETKQIDRIELCWKVKSQKHLGTTWKELFDCVKLSGDKFNLNISDNQFSCGNINLKSLQNFIIHRQSTQPIEKREANMNDKAEKSAMCLAHSKSGEKADPMLNGKIHSSKNPASVNHKPPNTNDDLGTKLTRSKKRKVAPPEDHKSKRACRTSDPKSSSLPVVNTNPSNVNESKVIADDALGNVSKKSRCTKTNGGRGTSQKTQKSIGALSLMGCKGRPQKGKYKSKKQMVQKMQRTREKNLFRKGVAMNGRNTTSEKFNDSTCDESSISTVPTNVGDHELSSSNNRNSAGLPVGNSIIEVNRLPRLTSSSVSLRDYLSAGAYKSLQEGSSSHNSECQDVSKQNDVRYLVSAIFRLQSRQRHLMLEQSKKQKLQKRLHNKDCKAGTDRIATTSFLQSSADSSQTRSIERPGSTQTNNNELDIGAAPEVECQKSEKHIDLDYDEPQLDIESASAKCETLQRSEFPKESYKLSLLASPMRFHSVYLRCLRKLMNRDLLKVFGKSNFRLGQEQSIETILISWPNNATSKSIITHQIPSNSSVSDNGNSRPTDHVFVRPNNVQWLNWGVTISRTVFSSELCENQGYCPRCTRRVNKETSVSAKAFNSNVLFPFCATCKGASSTLTILPTGTGKSLIYQFVAYYLSQHFHQMTLVICPLLSLIKDQIENLVENLRAVRIDHSLTFQDRQGLYDLIREGQFDIIFTTPEQLQRKVFQKVLLNCSRPIGFACFDEAHCVSEWGHNFRPAYLEAIGIITQVLGVPRILGITATASASTTLSIQRYLPNISVISPKQDIFHFNNLFLNVHKDQTVADYVSPTEIRRIFRIEYKLNAEANNEREDSSHDQETTEGNCMKWTRNKSKRILFCVWKQHVAERLARDLTRLTTSKIVCYHSGLSNKEREEAQNQFMNGQARYLVATQGIGIGIDMPAVDGVIHVNLPASIEQYIQEIGRCNRNGSSVGLCHLMLRDVDYHQRYYQIAGSRIDEAFIRLFVYCIFTFGWSFQLSPYLYHATNDQKFEHEIIDLNEMKFTSSTSSLSVRNPDCSNQNIEKKVAALKQCRSWWSNWVNSTGRMALSCSNKVLNLINSDSTQRKHKNCKDDINATESDRYVSTFENAPVCPIEMDGGFEKIWVRHIYFTKDEIMRMCGCRSVDDADVVVTTLNVSFQKHFGSTNLLHRKIRVVADEAISSLSPDIEADTRVKATQLGNSCDDDIVEILMDPNNCWHSAINPKDLTVTSVPRIQIHAIRNRNIQLLCYSKPLKSVYAETLCESRGDSNSDNQADSILTANETTYRFPLLNLLSKNITHQRGIDTIDKSKIFEIYGIEGHILEDSMLKTCQLSKMSLNFDKINNSGFHIRILGNELPSEAQINLVCKEVSQCLIETNKVSVDRLRIAKSIFNEGVKDPKEMKNKIERYLNCKNQNEEFKDNLDAERWTESDKANAELYINMLMDQLESDGYGFLFPPLYRRGVPTLPKFDIYTDGVSISDEYVNQEMMSAVGGSTVWDLFSNDHLSASGGAYTSTLPTGKTFLGSLHLIRIILGLNSYFFSKPNSGNSNKSTSTGVDRYSCLARHWGILGNTHLAFDKLLELCECQIRKRVTGRFQRTGKQASLE